MQKIAFFLLAILIAGCSCGRPHGPLKIGIDPNWYPIDFGPQTSYVNGYAEDLLLEMAQYTGMEFERIAANWDNLLDGLKEKKYAAVFSSLPPYEYNKAIYDFSKDFLALGPVLILPIGSPKIDLREMKGHVLGIITGDPAVLILEKNATLILRPYNTISELLNAVVSGELDGALLNRIPAVNYVGGLYAGKLVIASEPLTDAGLRLVSLKGEDYLVSMFNKNLNHLINRKRLAVLQEKWQLALK